MSENTNLPSKSAPQTRIGPSAFGGHTGVALHWIVLAGVAMVSVGAAAALTGYTEKDWIALIFPALALWVAWLYWRTIEGDRDVPMHLLHPHLAVPIVILLAHLVKQAGSSAAGEAGVLVSGDTSVLVRLMTLSLLVLLIQDVLARVRHLRWLLTAVGATMAVGAILRLTTAPHAAGQTAVALVGLAGVGVLVSPCLVPALTLPAHPLRRRALLGHFETTVRIALAALLAVGLTVLSPMASAAGALAVGGAMLLAGVFLRKYHLHLLAAGAILAVGGAVGLYRLGASLPDGLGQVRLLGAGEPYGSAAEVRTGLEMLAAATGWVGVAAVCLGMLTAVIWSLHTCRSVAPGDQARAALWAVVTALSGTALMVGGGLSIPAVIAAAALTFGLMPHMMAHRMKRFHGWPVAVAFAAVLVVLALEQRLGGQMWRNLARRYGDVTMHFFGALVLTVVLFWQTRSRRWWQALLCSLAGAGIAALGELAQSHFTRHRVMEASDAVADALGAAVALMIFLAIAAVAWIEKLWTTRPTKVSFEKYESSGLY